MCTYFLHYFTLLPLFPNTSPVTLVLVSPLGRTCSALLFFDFVEEKSEKIKQITSL
jgi:hypothetical protein